MESARRVLVVDPGGVTDDLRAHLAPGRYDLRVVDADGVTDALAEFDPDLLVIDLRHSEPMLFRRPDGVDGAERGTRLRRLLTELAATAPHHVVDDLEFDVAHQAVRRGGVAVALTSTETAILAILAADGGVVERLALVERIWGPGATTSNVLEVHVSSLRRKLDGLGSPVIRTVRGVGYGLNVPFSAHGTQSSQRVR